MTAKFFADPNSGYRCTLASDDMAYSEFTGSSFEDRQGQSLYRSNANTDALCWGDPGASCEKEILVPVVCQQPGGCLCCLGLPVLPDLVVAQQGLVVKAHGGVCGGRSSAACCCCIGRLGVSGSM